MPPTNDLATVLERLDRETPNNTQIRALAKEHRKDHALATGLWASGDFRARMLAILVFDLKAVDVEALEGLISDLDAMEGREQSQLLDWLIGNVVMKKPALKAAASEWRTSPVEIRRRVFWAVQARSVRGGEHASNETLLEHIEAGLASASGPIQWNMNWCAGQIGIADANLRDRCVALGERLGLYRDYPVSKGCTSPYLPIWIGSVVGKREGAAG